MHLDWRNVVAVAALNCADGNNTYVCDQFGIEDYPTLKLFPPQSVNTTYANGTFIEQGQEFYREDETPFRLKHVLDYLEPHFPNLLSFTNHSGYGTGTLAELWSSNNQTEASRPTAIVMIFENTISYLGKEIALGLSPHRGIQVLRFSNPNKIYDTYVAHHNSKILSPAVIFLGQDEIPKGSHHGYPSKHFSAGLRHPCGK